MCWTPLYVNKHKEVRLFTYYYTFIHMNSETDKM